jgi:hypothetical protein
LNLRVLLPISARPRHRLGLDQVEEPKSCWGIKPRLIIGGVALIVNTRAELPTERLDLANPGMTVRARHLACIADGCLDKRRQA